ncbi:MAG: DNA repair and recombination protein RadA [Candidatus Freyarchaeota archaeon]
MDLTNIKGVGPEKARKLMKAGYCTVESIAFSSSRDISIDSGIPEETVKAIVASAKEIVSSREGVKGGKLVKILPGKEAKKILGSMDHITTGLEGLDSILGGGIEICAMTEFYGPAKAGKTQMCHQLCATVQLPRERGGLEAPALYIDTERTMKYEHIEKIAERFGLDPELTTDNVFYACATNSEDLCELVFEDLDEVVQNRGIKLVIVDCLTGHFRAEYCGRESLPLRQQKINKLMQKLQNIALAYDLAVVVTNQVHSQPDLYGKSENPIGGHTVAHGVTFRLGLSIKRYNMRAVTVVDAPALPPETAYFAITSHGLVHITEDDLNSKKPIEYTPERDAKKGAAEPETEEPVEQAS